MRFSTRTRYGLRFLLRLALERPNVVTLAQIAAMEDISPGYLEQIVHALKPLKIFSSARGVGGGYTLSRPPEEIVLEDIFVRLEGTVSPVSCLDQGVSCGRSETCTVRQFWYDFEQHIRAFLRTKTLQNLLDSNESLSGGRNVGVHPGRA